MKIKYILTLIISIIIHSSARTQEIDHFKVKIDSSRSITIFFLKNTMPYISNALIVTSQSKIETDSIIHKLSSCKSLKNDNFRTFVVTIENDESSESDLNIVIENIIGRFKLIDSGLYIFDKYNLTGKFENNVKEKKIKKPKMILRTQKQMDDFCQTE